MVQAQLRSQQQLGYLGNLLQQRHRIHLLLQQLVVFLGLNLWDHSECRLLHQGHLHLEVFQPALRLVKQLHQPLGSRPLLVLLVLLVSCRALEAALLHLGVLYLAQLLRFLHQLQACLVVVLQSLVQVHSHQVRQVVAYFQVQQHQQWVPYLEVHLLFKLQSQYVLITDLCLYIIHTPHIHIRTILCPHH